MAYSKTQISLVRESRLFDAEWYCYRYPDVELSGLEPAEHYFRVGALLGRDPGPDFSTTGYLETYTDVARKGVNPLAHFESSGRGEGRSPTPDRAGARAPAEKRRAVDVVVPVFNALEDVKACLRSIAEVETGCDVRAIVINDGSDEETSAWLRETCARLGNDSVSYRLIEHEANKGYTVAVNTGLKASDAPYVVTLNSDTIVTPFWLDGLIRCMHSAPGIGITGPLSNAASWQNVPELRDADGAFAINALPTGMNAADMAGIVRGASARDYPRTTFVNGFCFMIRRAVIDAVGYMDEEAFPTGYGEENDFCIRAQDAGFALAYADDTYVFHAKSKSFGSERRMALSKAGGEALRAKHGAGKFAALVEQVGQTGPMDRIRARVQEAMRHWQAPAPTDALGWLLTQNVLFLLPVRGGGGGAHSVIQEAAAMRRLGVEVKVAVTRENRPGYERLYADVPELDALLVDFEQDGLVDLASSFDVVVATLFNTVPPLKRIHEACPWILPAYYVQDYEPFFYEEGTAMWKQAVESYTLIPGMTIFAKTHWIRERIEENHEVEVHKVLPSLDHGVYRPAPRPLRDDGTIRVSAMIRPQTPRRAAGNTMELLARLHDFMGDRLDIALFGCDETDADFQSLRRDFPFSQRGVLTRADVAALFQETDLFIDMSDYQAFGRSALEAMACGAGAVVPKRGGADEYAVDGSNALIVDTSDIGACFQRIAQLLSERERLARMRLEALETAAAYSPRRAAMSELALFARALLEWRQKHPRSFAAEADASGPVLAAAEPAAGSGGEAKSEPKPSAATDSREEALKAAHKRAMEEAKALVLSPEPAYSPKGYQVSPYFAGATMVLPYAPLSGEPKNVPTLDIGVQLHLHYPDLLDEFIRYLGNIPVPFHLYVSVPKAELVDDVARRMQARLPLAKIELRHFPNRGRDIGPFIAGFGEALSKHEYVCHIHSKRSPHNPAKQDWRAQLMTHLMGSPSVVAEIFRLFDKNPHLGMVFPEYHWSLADQIHWGTNFEACLPLAERMGLEISRERLDLFPAGSMFWARGAALKPLFDLKLKIEDFPAEQAQVDGTPAHAIERLLGTIAVQAGFRLQQVRSSKPHDLVSYFTAAWPYRGKSEAEMNRIVETYQSRRTVGAAKIGLLCANAGGYDTVPVHEFLDTNIDYHLAVDRPTSDGGFWTIHSLPDGGATATGKARAAKTDPFPYLDGYEIGIWADANVMIRENLAPYLKLVRDNPGIPLFGIPHPQRRCLYEEAQAVISHNKADPAKVRAQMDKYASEGYPKQNGLIESNFMIFNLRHPKIRELFALWRDQVANQTHRDQLSLNYALWKLGLDWMPLMTEGKNLRTEPQFAYFGHGNNSGYTPVSISSARVIDPEATARKDIAHA